MTMQKIFTCCEAEAAHLQFLGWWHKTFALHKPDAVKFDDRHPHMVVSQKNPYAVPKGPRHSPPKAGEQKGYVKSMPKCAFLESHR